MWSFWQGYHNPWTILIWPKTKTFFTLSLNPIQMLCLYHFLYSTCLGYHEEKFVYNTGLIKRRRILTFHLSWLGSAKLYTLNVLFSNPATIFSPPPQSLCRDTYLPSLRTATRVRVWDAGQQLDQQLPTGAWNPESREMSGTRRRSGKSWF